LRYGAAKKASERLMRQLEVVLSAVDVLALEAPTDTVYGELRARLEQTAALSAQTICLLPRMRLR
jgi:tRNA(fMet)-specific endonuclease VapC